MPRAELSHACSTGVPKRNVSQAQADPADADAIGDLADHDRTESSRRFRKRERAGADGGDRETVEDERGCVVRKPLPFEHDNKPPRQTEPARQRERRDHIRRRYDGS